jgi:membrane protein
MGARERHRQAWAVLRRAVADARADDLPTSARALAYSLFLAIPASLLVVVGVFSLVADEAAVESLVSRAGTVMPEEAVVLLQDSLERSIRSSGSGLVMTIVGLALAIWTTTSAATTLMKEVTRAFDRDDRRSFTRKRLQALAIVAALVAGAALVLGLLVLGPHLERWTGQATGAPTLVGWAWWTLQWPILVGGLLFAFSVVLYLGPDVEQSRWQLVTPGAIVAVVLWLVASAAFAVYTAGFGSYDKTWGTLSAVVVTLLWLWVTSGALLFGAEINAEAQRLAGAQRTTLETAPVVRARDARA